jgi:16S rRNA processing protein RimM
LKQQRKNNGTAPTLIAVGKLGACFGLKGYLKVQLYSSSPERVLELRKVYVGATPEDATEYRIEEAEIQHSNVVVKFESIEDRTEAEKLRGKFLFVNESASVKPAKGKFFVHEIIGCNVQTADGTSVGVIEDVLKLPGNDVWTVRLGGTTYMIPAVKEFVEKVDIENRTVTVKSVEGLIEAGHESNEN